MNVCDSVPIQCVGVSLRVIHLLVSDTPHSHTTEERHKNKQVKNGILAQHMEYSLHASIAPCKMIESRKEYLHTVLP